MEKKLKIHEKSTQKNGRADLGSGTLGPKGEGCFSYEKTIQELQINPS